MVWDFANKSCAKFPRPAKLISDIESVQTWPKDTRKIDVTAYVTMDRARIGFWKRWTADAVYPASFGLWKPWAVEGLVSGGIGPPVVQDLACGSCGPWRHWTVFVVFFIRSFTVCCHKRNAMHVLIVSHTCVVCVICDVPIVLWHALIIALGPFLFSRLPSFKYGSRASSEPLLLCSLCQCWCLATLRRITT